MSTVTPETYPSRAPTRGINRAHGWLAPARLLGRLGLLAAVTLATGLVYKGMLEPWHRTWGATPNELARSLPGDALRPDAGYVATRAVTINAPPQAIWPWIVQMGQGRGGLYSYDWLENLVGSDLHNADRIHPEWQHLAVGDSVRFIPERFLGRFDTGKLAWHVATIDPNRALVLKGAYALILQPIDAHTTRLIVRSRSGSALEASEPFNFIMARRMLLGIKERAEGAIRPRALDIAEVVSWMIAFGVSVAAGIGVLVRKEWQWSLAVLLGAIATFLALLFARPPLWAGGLLDLALVAALAWTYRPRPGIARA